MLAQRLRQSPNIKTLFERVVFAGMNCLAGRLCILRVTLGLLELNRSHIVTGVMQHRPIQPTLINASD